MAGQRGRAEAGDLGRGNRRGRLADEVGGLAPAAAEREGDVVPFDAGEACDVGGGARGDLERVGGGVVEDGCSCRTCSHSRNRGPAGHSRRVGPCAWTAA
jgi:hypothetical protein